MLENTLEIKLP